MINQSPACERNKESIAEQLIHAFDSCEQVLEVGSGSGQHVLHFAKQMPKIVWQPMDFGDYIATLQHNLQGSADNILAPMTLSLENTPWVIDVKYDGLFSANTLHIMSWDHVIGFFERAGKQLKVGGVLCIYGPFKYGGEFTSPSNLGFEQWLKQRDPLSGVRDFEAICELARQNHLSFVSDQAMPANNQFLIFNKNSH